MSLRAKRPLLLALATAWVACNAFLEPLPDQIIVGDFGAPNAMVHADSLSATIDLGCSLIQIKAPILTDDNGGFVLTGQRSRIGGVPPMPGEGTTPIRIDGRASVDNGGTLRLTLSPIPEEPGAPVGDATAVTAVRNKQANLLRCP